MLPRRKPTVAPTTPPTSLLSSAAAYASPPRRIRLAPPLRVSQTGLVMGIAWKVARRVGLRALGGVEVSGDVMRLTQGIGISSQDVGDVAKLRRSCLEPWARRLENCSAPAGGRSAGVGE